MRTRTRLPITRAACSPHCASRSASCSCPAPHTTDRFDRTCGIKSSAGLWTRSSERPANIARSGKLPFSEMRVRRRIGLGLGVLACVALGLALQAFWLEPASLRTSEERVSLPWPARTLRVAVLTDLHVGSPFNGIRNLRRVVDLTNEAHPDMVCILGDLVIQGVLGGRFVPPEDIAGELARLRSGTGTFAVLGNHDGWLDRERVRRALEANGVRVVE